MSRYNGTAICDCCGRTVSYKTKSSSNSSALSTDAFDDGCCLVGCLTLLIKAVFFIALIILGLFAIGMMALLVWIFT